MGWGILLYYYKLKMANLPAREMLYIDFVCGHCSSSTCAAPVKFRCTMALLNNWLWWVLSFT